MNKGRRWWKERRREESWQHSEDLETNSVCVGDVISLSWGSLLPPANAKLQTRPTPRSGLPPDNLVIGAVLGPKYLFSDAGKTDEAGGSLHCFPANRDLHQLITQTTQPASLWGPHRDTGSAQEGWGYMGGFASGFQWGVPSTDVFDVLYCLFVASAQGCFCVPGAQGRAGTREVCTAGSAVSPSTDVCGLM